MISSRRMEVKGMNKQHLIALITILSLLLPLAAVMAPLPTPQSDLTIDNEIQISPLIQENELALTNETGPLLTNIMNNPSFEERYSYGTPTGYSYYGSFGGWSDPYYQGEVYAGSYSGQIKGWGSTSSGSWMALQQSFGSTLTYILDGHILDFYYYIEEPGAIDQGSYIYLYVETVNSTNQWQGINYIFCHGSYNPNNYTNGVYYYMNETIGQWNHFSQNVTEDYLAYPDFWAGDTTRRINALYFYSNVQIRVTDPSTWAIDDVSMVNGTGYEFVINGDFESSGGWTEQSYSPATVGTSTDATHGMYSLNLSCTAIREGSTGYLGWYESKSYPWESFYPFLPNSMKIEYDWRYSDTWNGGNSLAYMRLRFRNETGYFYWYNYFGQDTDWKGYTNSSTNIYCFNDAFGSRDTWEHETFDVSAGLDEVGWTNLTAYEFRFYISLGTYANASIELLIDDFQVNTFTTGDPGFEIDLWDGVNPPLGTWPLWSMGPSITRTSDAHSGFYACNITVANNLAGGVYRADFETTIDPSMVTDWWWRTDYFSDGSSSFFYGRFRLEFNYSYTIYYYLAKDFSYNPANTSTSAHIHLDGLNTTGVWVNTYRNISADLEEAFGAGTFYLNRFVCEAQTGAGENISIIFDDIGFADAVPPVIETPSQTSDPKYYEITAIDAVVTDALSGVMGVELYYRLDGGNWIAVECSNVGDLYSAEIPMLSYGTFVEYYLYATDWTGTIGINDNGGSYYSYTVGDDIDPTVNLTGINSGQEVSDFVLLEAIADDIAAGVDYVDFQVDSISVGIDDTAPYQTYWDSRTSLNGTRVVTAIAHDFAGNTETDSISVDVQNDVEPPVLTHIVVNPTEPQYDQDFTIFVGVTDASELLNVTIHYHGIGPYWDTIGMPHDGALYYRTFQGYPFDTVFEFYIVAYDYYEQSYAIGTESTPLSFTVTDSVAPELGVNGPPTFDAVRDTVYFAVSATDLGSGISSIELSVDGVLETTTTGDIISWNTLEFENGNYTLTFTANDNAGNTASIELEYMVQNPVGFERLVEGLQNVMSQYGFFVGAAAVVLVYAGGTVLIRRRAGAAGASSGSSKAGTKGAKKTSKAKKKK